MKKIREKEYQLIGVFLVKTYPEIAQQIISTYIKPEPLVKDFSLIPVFFETFCEIIGKQPEKVKGILNKQELVNERRLFVSAMIRLYNPQIHNHPSNCIRFNIGFNKSMALNMNLNYSTMSRMIKECVVHEKVYSDLKQRVTEMVASLQNRGVEKLVNSSE